MRTMPPRSASTSVGVVLEPKRLKFSSLKGIGTSASPAVESRPDVLYVFRLDSGRRVVTTPYVAIMLCRREENYALRRVFLF